MHVEAPEGTLLTIHYEAPDHVGFKHLKPTTITVTQHAPLRRVRDYLNPSSKPPPKPKPSINTITQHSGKILHRVEQDGQVSICLRSLTADATKSPQRYGIHVTSGNDESHYQQEGAEHHLSKLQTHVMKLSDEMVSVLAEADMAKEREMVYHEQNESMHSGAMYWPMLHVCVLVLVGITQAAHMINFFKSKSLV